MFERPKSGERAVLVHVDLTDESQKEALSEFKELAVSAGVDVAAVVCSQRQRPDPKYFLGSGKVEELRQLVADGRADVVLVNHALTPSQERNLEKEVQCRVLDRAGLILDIFAQRARSHDGRLQVELAQLEHLSTRLVRGWTHLERQRGGIGLRGPGETQLETDRRLIAGRIKQLQKRLGKVQSRRQQGRRARKRAEIPTVSLVGYTNAGKSTLFNSLTRSEIYAADQLFATLDPTLRRVELPDAQPVILADTVGFIRHLPHQLVAAFRSTLEETGEADLLLHVIDAADPEKEAHIQEVHKVLAEIGADNVPRLEIYNKIDLLEGMTPRIDRDAEGKAERVWLSAAGGQGLVLVQQAVADFFRDRSRRTFVQIPINAGRLRSQFYRLGVVLQERVINDQVLELEVEMPEKHWQALDKDAEFAGLLIYPADSKYLAGAA